MFSSNPIYQSEQVLNFIHSYPNFVRNNYYDSYCTNIESMILNMDPVANQRHHVVPKSFCFNNITILVTADEHLRLHKLLCKFTIGLDRKKMLYVVKKAKHVGGLSWGLSLDEPEVEELEEVKPNTIREFQMEFRSFKVKRGIVLQDYLLYTNLDDFEYHGKKFNKCSLSIIKVSNNRLLCWYKDCFYGKMDKMTDFSNIVIS